MPKRGLLALLLAALLSLGGCVAQVSETRPPAEELPGITISHEAPRGDSVEARRIPAVLYYLSQDASYLVASTTQVEVESGQTPAEAVVRTLLGGAPDGLRRVAPEDVEPERMTSPVMVLENLAVVSLSATARSLSPEDFFTLRMALTNTLTELSGIDYVTVLVEGREEGLDLAGRLPAGALAHHSGGDIASLWSQMEVQQERSALQGVSKSVPLFLPALGGRYVVPQVRNISFSGITERDYVMGILSELGRSAGEAQRAPLVTDLVGYLVTEPHLVMIEESPDRILRLDFSDRLENALMQQGMGRGVFLAMLTQTITAFVPRIDAVQVSFGGQVVERLEEIDTVDWQVAEFPEGKLRRADFLGYVGAYMPLRFPTQDESRLSRVRRAVPFAQVHSPRAMLRQLTIGLMPHEEEGLLPALPEHLEETDILAVQVTGDVALVNCSRRFAQAIGGGSEKQERNWIYAVVNLLTSLPQVRRVAFFVEGAQQASFGGRLDYSGYFYLNPGLE